MANENFNALVEAAMKIGDLSHMRAVVEKELLHYDILFILDKENLLDKITFQGGTALRLCYGGQRFSEDLDFAGGTNFKSADFMQIKKCIETYIGSRYGLEVSIKEPKDLEDEEKRNGIQVDKWQIKITTAPNRPDLPKQMIKLEIARVPAYSSNVKALINNYEFLPDGYSDTLILVESLDEIMADKLIAFPCSRLNIRYRDLWDLQWLKKQGAVVNIDFIKKKIEDYKINNYENNLESIIKNIPDIIQSNNFKTQMSRFIPISVQERTLKKEKFYFFLENEIRDMFKQVLELI